MTNIRNRITAIYRHLISRRVPFGLFSWRFLLPKQSPAIRFHRRLIAEHFPQLPLLIFFPIIIFTGLRWAVFYSPYYTFKVVKNRGKNFEQRTGLSLWQQYWQILVMSAAHGLFPSDWYKFQLYNKKKNMWNFVYTQETGSFHRYRNRGRPYYQEHTALLGDKFKFETLMKEQGIRTAESLLFLPKNTSDFYDQLINLTTQHGELFCKRQTGNQGRGAFYFSLQKRHLQVTPHNGVILPLEEAHSFLEKNTSQYSYLIQPHYKAHRSLRDLSRKHQSHSCTIRIISHCHESQIHLEFAVLNWPVIDNEQNVKFYYPIAVEPYSGKLDKTHQAWPRDNLNSQQLAALNELFERFSDTPLPHWSESTRLTRTAHSLLKGVDKIAWDFILTEDRAVLLEGNSSWGGLAVCQWFGYDPK